MVRKRGLDPKKYERRAWNQRLSNISSARHLAEAVLDFEDHILAENLRPSFIRSRETEFVKHLRRQQKRTVYSSLEKFNAFSDITLALENLRCNLCPPAKYRTMMSLVRCRFERTGLVPKHALGRILEFVGAPLYFKMHEQMCRQLREQVHATSPESKEPLAANDDYGIKSPSPSHGYIIPSDMYSWLNPLSARFRYQAFVANRHICQLAMASTRFQICEDEEGWRNLELVWKSRFRFSSRHEVFRSEPKVWLEAVFNGNSAFMYPYLMYPFLETRSEYRRTNSGPPFVEPRRFDRDIGETISEGIVASWYEPLNTSNTLINKPQDDTKTQVP